MTEQTTTEELPDAMLGIEDREPEARLKRDGVLKGRIIAILCTDGVEQIELTKPREALEHAGATTFLVSPKDDAVQAFHHHDKGDKMAVDVRLSDAEVDSFDALLLPGGALNPDALRADEAAVRFVRELASQGKPIAAICHGPWTLIEAGLVRGKHMTSWPSIKTDLVNAGAEWADVEVVSDHGLVTSRGPDDLPAFNRRMIEAFREGAPKHA